MRAKKHVLIEKPMAIKSEEVKTLIEEASKNNVKIMEGFMYAFHPQFDRVMNTIKSNILGRYQVTHIPCFHFQLNLQDFIVLIAL